MSFSLLGLLLKHFIVRFHAFLDVVLLSLEDGKRHCVQVAPHLVLMHPEVRSHALD